jgi:hypothetical protein
MSINLRFPVRSMALLVLMAVVGWVSFGAMGSSQAKASNGPFKVYLPIIVKPAVVYLPILARPTVVTAFGAFLDAPGVNNGLAQMSTAGATWARILVSWSKVESSAGQRDWGNVATLENKLKAVSNHHMNAILYIDDTPSWALKAGYPCGAVAQDKFEDLARFLTDLVTRYSVAPFNVKYYELWNEPDVAGGLGCWGDTDDTTFYGGGYYGEMLKVAYPAIKAADPQAQVLFGGLLMDCNPDHVEYCGGDPADKRRIGRFLEGALVDGAAPFFDGISFHAYDYYGGGLGQYSNSNWGTAWNTTGPVVLAKAAYLRNLLAQYNVNGKYLMNTEVAMLCGRTGQEPVCTTSDHEATLSSYILQSFAAGMADGLGVMVWFSVAGWRGSGLLDANLTPLPPYNAYKNARVWLGGAGFIRTVTDFTGIQGYEFSNNGLRIWVLWSVIGAGNPLIITLGMAPRAVYDMYGTSLPPASSLNIGLEPLFVVFKP